MAPFQHHQWATPHCTLERAEAILHAKQQVKEAYATLHKVQQDVRRIRETFLEDLAAHMADT
jgi:hypothetical protein